MTATAQPRSPDGDAASARRHVRVGIVGAGFAGLGMEIRLKAAGEDDFVVWEREEEIGGTWWANTYPGCRCDIPSHLYSFSFAPNPHWRRTYAPQPEIEDYLRRVTDQYGVRPHVRTNCAVTSAVWHEPDDRWRVRTAHGEYTRRRPPRRSGPAERAVGPGRAGPRHVRRYDVPHLELGPRPRPHGPPRRRDRHRRVGAPGRPRDPAA